MEDMLHPELAISCAKKGSDLLLALGRELGPDDRFVASLRPIDQLAAAVVTQTGAFCAVIPEGHNPPRGAFAPEGADVVYTLDSRELRDKHFQDRIDFEVLYERAAPAEEAAGDGGEAVIEEESLLFLGVGELTLPSPALASAEDSPAKSHTLKRKDPSAKKGARAPAAQPEAIKGHYKEASAHPTPARGRGHGGAPGHKPGGHTPGAHKTGGHKEAGHAPGGHKKPRPGSAGAGHGKKK
jgi:hypothetical protein